MTEADRLDMKISEPFIFWVNNQVLGFHGHKLWEQPCAEELAVERLIPLVVIIFKSILKLNKVCVGLHSSNIEELFVNLLIVVGVWTAEVIGLPNCLLHLKGIYDSEGDIINENRLNFAVHSLNEPIHAIEYFHLHSELASKSWVHMDVVHHQGWAQNCYIWEDFFNLLFSKPLSS